MPSTLETIDKAFYDWVDDNLNVFSTTNEGWKKVPLIWVSAERSFQVKTDKDLRDDYGVLKLPLITIERKSIVKDPNRKGIYQANIPPKMIPKVERLCYPPGLIKPRRAILQTQILTKQKLAFLPREMVLANRILNFKIKK